MRDLLAEKELRILVIQPWIRLGGAELISVHLARELEKRGQDVAIVATYLDLSGMPPNAGDVRVILPSDRVSRLCKKSRLVFLALAPWVLLYLTWRNSAHVDILNAHNFPSMWIAALVGTIRRIPVVWTCNEPPERIKVWSIPSVGIGDSVGWLLASSPLDKLFARGVSGTYVPSEMTGQQVRKRYATEPSIIPIGVDSGFFESTPDRDLRDELGLKDRFILLYVGKLHLQKNQLAALAGLKQVVDAIPSAVLLLAGDGVMASRYREYVSREGLEEHVRFLGHVGSKTVRNLYAIADLNLFVPLNQSYGLTPFEAVSAGTLSIVSNECGAAEIIGREHIGIVCKPTADEIARRIIDVYRYPEGYAAQVEKGREYVRRCLSWGEYSERVLHLFERAVREGLRLPDANTSEELP